MQNARAVDDVEGFRMAAHRKEVRLPVLDVPDAELLSLALRVGEAREAQIDRQHTGIRKPARGADRMSSRATAGDQNARRRLRQTGEVRMREQVA